MTSSGFHTLESQLLQLSYPWQFSSALVLDIKNDRSLKVLNIGYVEYHCIKSVRIQSYSGPYFPPFGLRISPYSFRIWENPHQNNFEYGHFSRSLCPHRMIPYSHLDQTTSLKGAPPIVRDIDGGETVFFFIVKQHILGFSKYFSGNVPLRGPILKIYNWNLCGNENLEDI